MNQASITNQEGGQYWTKLKKYGQHLEYTEGLEAKLAYHENMIDDTEKELQHIEDIIAGKREENRMKSPVDFTF